MHSKSRLPFVVVSVLGALLLVTGCGGSDTTDASLTKAQYVKMADQICEDAEKEQLELATAYLKKHPGAEEEAMIVPIGLPPLEKQTEKLKALSVPEGDDAQVEAMIGALETALDDTRADPGSALAAASNPFEKSNELFEKYGPVECAGSP